MPSYSLKSRYGYVRLDEGDADFLVPATDLLGEGTLAGPVTLTQNVVTIASALSGEGTISQAVSVTAWNPGYLGATKLRFWTRPESSKFQDAARTTAANTAADPVASSTDESGNGFHAQQTVGANRPTFRAGGGLSLSGSQWLVTAALGAWAADYVVGVVCKSTSSSSYERITETDYSVGHALTMLNDASGYSKSAIYDPGSPYGMSNATSLGTSAHTLFDSRVGSAHEYQVDGGTPASRTLSGAQLGALNNGSFYIGTLAASPGLGGYSMVGDIHEVFVVAAPSATDILLLKGYMAARLASGVYALQRQQEEDERTPMADKTTAGANATLSAMLASATVHLYISGVEIGGGLGYSSQPFGTVTPASGVAANAADIVFGNSTASWGTPTTLVVKTSGGVIYMQKTLTMGAIAAAYNVKIVAGALTLTET